MTSDFLRDMVRELKAKPDIGALPREFDRTPEEFAPNSQRLGVETSTHSFFAQAQQRHHTDYFVRGHSYDAQRRKEILQVTCKLFANPQ
jgi:hypothetical protein